MLVRRTEVFPVECVVCAATCRGRAGRTSSPRARSAATACRRSERVGQVPAPIFTPATKAETGTTRTSARSACATSGSEATGAALRDTALALYHEAETYARGRGIIIADTKFEFGLDGEGRVLLIDEALTPDSSRFWPAEAYEPGHSQPSFDKQFVRDYLETLDWDKRAPAPPLPPQVAAATTARYLEAHRLLTGKSLESGV